jgi:hypothetical protein
MHPEPLRHQLADLISVCDRLPERTIERIEAALVSARRDVAAAELSRLLNIEQNRTDWAIARDLAGRLDRFESSGWIRIRDGYRPPQNRVESLLVDMIRDPTCPRSPRRLLDLLD